VSATEANCCAVSCPRADEVIQAWEAVDANETQPNIARVAAAELVLATESPSVIWAWQR
jgi:hypothetical protein